MHTQNAFITLTYSDEHLPGPKLVYADFQKFMKKLRKLQDAPMGVFVTGEYGEKEKRPHWHAIIFNWAPSDGVYSHSNVRGDKCYTSATLDKCWGKGRTEYGSVTFESAGYCARYAAKKLVHGRDQEHDYHPISKKSSKHAIGKAWLEKYWPDVFNHGHIVLPDGSTTSIPRYYEKWLKEHKPTEWLRYVTTAKNSKILTASDRARLESEEFQKVVAERRRKTAIDGHFRGHPRTKAEAKRLILESKFQQLQNNLKL